MLNSLGQRTKFSYKGFKEVKGLFSEAKLTLWEEKVNNGYENGLRLCSRIEHMTGTSFLPI
jgi:hypothetical protein